MRTFLRRILLAWWMIPSLWITAYPIFWLLDPLNAKQFTKEVSEILWNGDNTGTD